VVCLRTIKEVNEMKFLRDAWGTNDSAIWLALIRILIGWKWLQFGWEKVVDPEFVKGMAGTLNFFGSDNPNAWYVAFINQVAIPNARVFGYLVAYGELLVGISLILGFITAVGAIFGVFMNVNYYFASGHLSASTAGLNQVMIVVQVILFLTAAGKALGVDQLLYRWLPRLFPWLPERIGERA